MNKTGTGTAALTGANSSVGNVTVSAGGLALNQNGAFRAVNYTTQANATTSISNSTQLKSTGAFTQSANSILNVAESSAYVNVSSPDRYVAAVFVGCVTRPVLGSRPFGAVAALLRQTTYV